MLLAPVVVAASSKASACNNVVQHIIVAMRYFNVAMISDSYLQLLLSYRQDTLSDRCQMKPQRLADHMTRGNVT